MALSCQDMQIEPQNHGPDADRQTRAEGLADAIQYHQAGNPGHFNDRNRSCGLAVFAPLTKMKEVTFFSLQLGAAADQTAQVPHRMNLVDFTAELNDFSDTAPPLLPILIWSSRWTPPSPIWPLQWRKTCGSCCHLLPTGAGMLERSDSPWYPTMRLFRQAKPGDWQTVSTRVAGELHKLVC